MTHAPGPGYDRFDEPRQEFDDERAEEALPDGLREIGEHRCTVSIQSGNRRYHCLDCGMTRRGARIDFETKDCETQPEGDR